MMNLKPVQIIAIGAGVVFGLPIVVGLIVGHFSSFRLGVAAGILILVAVLFLGHRQLMKRAREQEKENRGDDD